MVNRSGFGVLWAGLILIAVGCLFLANNFFHVSAWRVVSLYWPVIPLAIGLRKLYRYFTWQEPAPAPDAPGKE